MLSRGELDETPEGWLEELVLQEAGWDSAEAVARKRHEGKRRPSGDDEGQPVYGMPGQRFVPGKGMT